MSYLEIAERGDGLVVRIVGDNHENVLSSTSQLYADERDALNAIAVAAQAFGIHLPRPLQLHKDEYGEGILDGRGRLITFRRADERTAGGSA